MLEVKTYKNWKELCNAMDWSNKGGNTKKKYLKQLESLCKYHKNGNSYIIEEIYDKPKPIEDNRGGKKVYTDSFLPLVLDILSKHYIDKETTLCISSSMVMKDFAMADEELLELYYKLDGISKSKEEIELIKSLNPYYEPESINYNTALVDYISSYRTKTMSRFTTVLKKLQKDNLIRFYPKNIRIREYTKYKDDKGNDYYKLEYKWATDEQIKAILDMENEILEGLSKENGYIVCKQNLRRLGLQTTFRNKVTNYIKNTNNPLLKDIKRYFNATKIILTDKFEMQLLENKERLTTSIEYLELSKQSDIDSKNSAVNNYKTKKMEQAEKYSNNKENFNKYLELKWKNYKKGFKEKVIDKWRNSEEVKEEFLKLNKIKYNEYVEEYAEEYDGFIKDMYSKINEMKGEIDGEVNINEFIEIENEVNKSQSLDGLISSAKEEEQQQRNTQNGLLGKHKNNKNKDIDR